MGEFAIQVSEPNEYGEIETLGYCDLPDGTRLSVHGRQQMHGKLAKKIKSGIKKGLKKVAKIAVNVAKSYAGVNTATALAEQAVNVARDRAGTPAGAAAASAANALLDKASALQRQAKAGEAQLEALPDWPDAPAHLRTAARA